MENKADVELQPTTISSSQPTQRRIEVDTKEILEKIAEVNKKQGLTPRRQKPNYFHFPFSYYSRSHEDSRDQERLRSDFRFSSNPFTNPIFDYLEREKEEQSKRSSQYGTSTTRMAQELNNNEPSYVVSMVDPNAAITDEDKIPGQTVKRKIIHQQTFIIPNPNMMIDKVPIQMPMQQIPSPVMGIPNENQGDSQNQNHLSNLEKQTVNNIRNIVSNSQLQFQPLPIYYNPYVQNQIPNQIMDTSDKSRYGFLSSERNSLGQISDYGYNYQLLGPYSVPNGDKARQNWNWPGANYFPIYIRDPFLQMYNAVTSMIEYGPNAGNQNPCPGSRPVKKKTGKDVGIEDDSPLTTHNDGKDCSNVKENVDLVREGKSKDLGSNTGASGLFDIKSIEIGTNKDDTLKFSISMNDRESKGADSVKPSWDKVKTSTKANALQLNASRISTKFSDLARDVRPSTILKLPQPTKNTIISPPTRDPTHQTNEFGEESEEEKSEEVISNDGNKKLFSRDNTGSGVFIHKLKVRKGGVAIAGPGGIATAGSGGTAIVGPNGVAYTHPDSLAIAGSGTKVVAVDPTINLGDLVGGNNSANKTNPAAFPLSRVGRVVAIGPVVYYNKG